MGLISRVSSRTYRFDSLTIQPTVIPFLHQIHINSHKHNMKFIIPIILFAFVIGYSEAVCHGYWGPTCNNACGACAKEKPCDKTTGVCPESGTTGACVTGWKGKSCDEPICFGGAGCENEGKCVAPDYCVCGESGAQVVGVNKMYDGIQGVNCVSLRKDGIKGAFIALAVMSVSISVCGIIAEKRR